MNQATIIGRLGADPEVRFLPDGNPVANIRIATDERFKTRDGESVKRTEWHRCVLFGAVAKTAQQYLSKGRLVMVQGRLQTREWVAQDGIKRYTTEIIGQALQFLDSAPKELSNDQAPTPSSFEAQPAEDDIPF